MKKLITFLIIAICYISLYPVHAESIQPPGTIIGIESVSEISTENMYHIGSGTIDTPFTFYFRDFYVNTPSFYRQLHDPNLLDTGYYRVEYRSKTKTTIDGSSTYYRYIHFDFYYDADLKRITHYWLPEPTVESWPYAYVTVYFYESRDYVRLNRWYYLGWNQDTVSLYKLNVNVPPQLNLLTTDIKAATEPELSSFKVEGFVQDSNNQTLTLTAQLIRDDGVVVNEKTQKIANTAVAKEFAIPYDVFTDKINQGSYTLKLTVFDGYLTEEKEISVTVKARVKNGAYILVDEPVYYSTIYEDPEGDRKYLEQFKFDHDPLYFENSMGKMEGTGIWSTTAYTSFPKVGLLQGVHRAQDNPHSSEAFAEFRRWSKESLGMIEFKVHRRPVADFTVSIETPNGYLADWKLNLVDYSYDLDHLSESNKGIVEWEWQWKRRSESNWRSGKLQTITTSDQSTTFEIRLRVRDIDGPDGKGVWSDWVEKSITPYNYESKPVALFDIIPQTISHTKEQRVVDRSYATNGYTIYERHWYIERDGVNIQYIENRIPTASELKQAGLGKYLLKLRVRAKKGNSISSFSDMYSMPYEVVNYPPIADFATPEEVYRDTVIRPTNLTTDPDGEPITYQWKLLLGNREFNLGTATSPSFSIQEIIQTYGLTPHESISDDWMIKLTATDTLGASSSTTEAIRVLNRAPVAVINGPNNVKQYEKKEYKSSATDPDSADNPLAVYRWKLIRPDGSIEEWSQKDVSITFDMVGEHTLEHWVYDQIGEMSSLARKTISVQENLPPVMTITVPSGTKENPSVMIGSPNVQWNYFDPEGDPQERYSFDFFLADNDLLFHSIGADDPSGNIRNHVMPQENFKSSVIYKILGRSYSKFKWSGISNEVYFMINTPPRVEIINPASSNPLEPTSFSENRPTIQWVYQDEDGHPQRQFRIYVRNAHTGELLSSSTVTSTSSQWKLNSDLVEDTVYYVEMQVFDGYEWSEMSQRKYMIYHSLKIEGYLLPNPAMAGDQIIFHIITEGYADRLEIVVPEDMIAMDQRAVMGYEPVPYPSLYFDVDGSKNIKEDILKYTVWVTTEKTLTSLNSKLRDPYKFIVRAYRGTIVKEIELELDIRGDIRQLLRPGIKNKH